MILKTSLIAENCQEVGAAAEIFTDVIEDDDEDERGDRNYNRIRKKLVYFEKN